MQRELQQQGDQLARELVGVRLPAGRLRAWVGFEYMRAAADGRDPAPWARAAVQGLGWRRQSLSGGKGFQDQLFPVAIDSAASGMKTLQIPGDINALVEELRGIRSRKKADEARETEITTKLKEFTQQEPAMLRFNKDVVAMLEQDTQRRIDSDRLKAKYPDIAVECSKTLTFLRVKVVA